MLLLSRYQNERIIIQHAGYEVVLTVIEVRPYGSVKLGFEADREFRIYREELLTRRKDGR